MSRCSTVRLSLACHLLLPCLALSLLLCLVAGPTTALQAATGPTLAFTVTPCRILDTRTSPGAPLTANVAHEVDVRGLCDVPEGAVGLFYSVTVISPSSQGYLQVYGAPVYNPVTDTYGPPLSAALTYAAGTTVTTSGALAEMAPEDEAYDLLVRPAYASAHVVIDVTGYSAFAPTTRVRGTVADVETACPSPGACLVRLTFEDGESVLCSPDHIYTSLCAAYDVDDCVTASGHIAVLGGAPELYVHTVAACPAAVP